MHDIILQALSLIFAIFMALGSAALKAHMSKSNAEAAEIITRGAIATLHTALATGVDAAFAKAKDGQPSVEEIVNSAISHAEASIPDTLAKLKPSVQVMANIALSKITNRS